MFSGVLGVSSSICASALSARASMPVAPSTIVVPAMSWRRVDADSFAWVRSMDS
jgi:hypothetical protein